MKAGTGPARAWPLPRGGPRRPASVEPSLPRRRFERLWVETFWSWIGLSWSWVGSPKSWLGTKRSRVFSRGRSVAPAPGLCLCLNRTTSCSAGRVQTSTFHVNLDGSALSVVPDQRDRGRYRPDIGRRACDGCQRRGNDSAPLRSGVQLLLLAYWAPQRVLMRWYVGAVTPGTSGRSGTEFDILRHRGHWRSSGCSPSWHAEGSTGGPTRG